jgi:fatty aldehyde-generating acyl-ACP reductase
VVSGRDIDQIGISNVSDDTFAFIIHPIDPKGDVERKYPLLGRMLPEPVIHFLCTYWPPVYISEIEGVRSAATGRETRGWFVAAPYTPRRMLEIPERQVYRKIVQTGRLAEKLGARILGLGAFTSVVGDAGITIARQLDIPVTTGDAYTVAIAAQAILEAGRMMGIDAADARAAVVGATGAIGGACAALLADHLGALALIGRRRDALDAVRERCEGGRATLTTSTDLAAIREADLILTVTSSISTIVEPEHLKPGAVVLDVARPRDVSARVAAERTDVLVVEGGMVQVPGPVNFNFDFGFPPGKAYACMAETMALALEGRYEDYTLGRDIAIDRIREIDAIASKHGFRLSGLRSFEREVTPEHVARVRERAHRALRAFGTA